MLLLSLPPPAAVSQPLPKWTATPLTLLLKPSRHGLQRRLAGEEQRALIWLA